MPGYTMYSSTIKDFKFHPFADRVPSILQLWIYVPKLNIVEECEVKGSIPILADRFGFKIVNEHEWDFTGLKGRECWVKIIEDDKIQFWGMKD